MSIAIVVLIARIALVLSLYLFLFLVVRAMRRDLRHIAPASQGRRPRAQAATGTAQLIVLAVGQTAYQVGQRFSLQGQTVLGRDPGTDIPVEDDFVSAQHLTIRQNNGLWLAQDMNSTNGTRINGTRLRGSAPLKPGDILELGRLQLRFTVER